GFHIDSPTKASSGDTYSLTLEGWIVPQRAAPEKITLVAAGRPAWIIPVNVHRPDVAPLYPDISWAGLSGFQTSVGAAALPPEFLLGFVVDVAGRPPLTIAQIRGTRKPLPSSADPRFLPIMLTTLGRTGGTWVIRLLSRHPEILALRPFAYEPRIAAYWM